MSRKRIYLDCTKLTRSSVMGKKMIPRLRQYCASRFADFDRTISDENLFLFLYCKSIDAPMSSEFAIERVAREYEEWVNGSPAPNYLCSWFRTALSDRAHCPTLARSVPVAA